MTVDTLSWEAGETQQEHTKDPRQSPGLLLPPFEGGEITGIKNKNKQRSWDSPCMFLLSPDEMHACLFVAFAFP